MEVAFLGLGAMGRSMAFNLAQAGHTVRGWNRTPRAMPELEQVGVEIAPTPAAAVNRAELICMCLYDDAAVESVLSRIWEHVVPGSILVDHSTVAVETARRMAAAAWGHGVTYLDAPVSGGVDGAKAATLTIMVGGDPSAFERVSPALRCLGQRVDHLGPPGSGLAAKLINQFLTAVHQLAAVEALALAAAAGLDVARVGSILQQSYGASRMLERTVPRVLTGDFDSPFQVALLHKDLERVLYLRTELEVSCTLATVALEAYSTAEAAGLGKRDAAALIQIAEPGPH